MNGIIKTIKTTQYAQIHNAPLQRELEDLRSIGLLSHLMSLPEGWSIKKTQLHSRFSRKNVDAAWKELAEKNYAVGFSCYIDGKKDYFYAVSDIPISQETFDQLVIEQIKGLQEEGKTVKSPDVIKHSPLVIAEVITDALSVQQSNFTDVPRVQYSEYSTQSTLINKKDIKEIFINKKISSRETIDNELLEKYPNIPFDQIKDQMLNDETLTVDTDKQYKSMLEYRLKNWKPVTKKRNAIIRKEMVPEWLNKDLEEAAKEFKTIPEEIAKKKAKIEEQLRSLGGKL